MTTIPGNSPLWTETSVPIGQDTVESSPQPLDPPVLIPPPVPPLWTPADLDADGKVPAGSRLRVKRFRVASYSILDEPEPLFETPDGCTTWGVLYCVFERVETWWLLGSQEILLSVEEKEGFCYRRGVTVCPDGTYQEHDWGYDLVIGDPEDPDTLQRAQDFFDRWGDPPPAGPWMPPDILLAEQGTSEAIDGDCIVHRRYLLKRFGPVRVQDCIATATYRHVVRVTKWQRVGAERGPLVDGYPREEGVPNQPPVIRSWRIPGCVGQWTPTVAHQAAPLHERVEAIGDQLRGKIAGKFQTSTFLAGFAAAVLGIEITLLWQQGVGPGLLPFAIALMSAAIALYIVAVVRLDALTMPKRFWREAGEEAERDPAAARAALLTDEDLWELRKRMIFHWYSLTLFASALAGGSLLCLLAPVLPAETDLLAQARATVEATLAAIAFVLVYLLVIALVAKRRFAPLRRVRD